MMSANCHIMMLSHCVCIFTHVSCHWPSLKTHIDDSQPSGQWKQLFAEYELKDSKEIDAYWTMVVDHCRADHTVSQLDKTVC